MYYNQGFDHDYENMRYNSMQATATSAPPPTKDSAVRQASHSVPSRLSARDRKLGRGGPAAAAVRGGIPETVSLVSEDAEVTAITHSSSPGSSVSGGGGGKRSPAPAGLKASTDTTTASSSSKNQSSS